MKIKFVVLMMLMVSVTFTSCKNEVEKQKPSKAYIHGKILNYEQDTLFLNNVTLNSMLLKDVKHKIPLNGNNEFSYTIDLDEPQYFQTERTFLYLSPGDSLQMTIDTQSRAVGVYEGTGKEANDYLRNLPYPKGGSFFGNLRQKGLEVKSKEDMQKTFKPILDEELKTLDTLSNISKEFLALEKARLKFEYINSLQSSTYLYIQDMISKKITPEEMQVKIKEADTYNEPYITETLSGMDYNNTEYLQFEVFGNVLYKLMDSTYTKSNGLPTLNQDLKDYLLASNLKQQFSRQGFTKDFTDYYDSEIVKINNKDYQNSLNDLLKQYEPLKSGASASNVTFTNLKGDEVKLTDFKGKVIVVDLWATWCGPCMAEKPTFEALVDKYKDNENIALLSVSIDTRKDWTNYFQKEKEKGIQLHINRSDLSAYQIVGIPRFFVIDKNFNIVDVFAPLPSSGKLEEMFKEYM